MQHHNQQQLHIASRVRRLYTRNANKEPEDSQVNQCPLGEAQNSVHTAGESELAA